MFGRDALAHGFLIVFGLSISVYADGPPGSGNPDPETLVGGTPRFWEAGVPVSTYSTLSTYDGNLLTTVPIVGWTGTGPDVNMVLFHNSRLAGGTSLTSATLGGEIGIGWSMSCSAHLIIDIDSVTYVGDDGTRNKYALAPYVGPGGEPVWLPPRGVFSELTQDGADWLLTHKDQSHHQFDPQGRLKFFEDSNGYRLTIARPAYFLDDTVIFDATIAAGQPRTLRLSKVSANGRILISSITDLGVAATGDERSWSFTYDSKGRLV